MKLNLSIDFESVAEMKAILMTPYPFGGFPDNLVDVEAAETAIAEVKQAKAKRAKKSGTKTELAAAMEETAPVATAPAEPVQTLAPVAAVPAAPVAVAPTAPVVEPTQEPVAAPTAVPTSAPVAPTEPVNVAPTPVTPVAPTATATYTTDDLARAAVGLVDAGRQAELISVMSKYGVVALPDLPADRYTAFAADLRALGVAI